MLYAAVISDMLIMFLTGLHVANRKCLVVFLFKAATVTEQVDTSKPPPKPPRLSDTDLPQESIDANHIDDQTTLPAPGTDKYRNKSYCVCPSLKCFIPSSSYCAATW